MDNKISSFLGRLWLDCNSKLRVYLVVHTQLVLAHSSMENALHARAQILAGVRRGRIGFLDCWVNSGRITRGNSLTPMQGRRPAPRPVAQVRTADRFESGAARERAFLRYAEFGVTETAS